MTFKQAQDAYSAIKFEENIFVLVLVVMTLGLIYLLSIKFFDGTKMHLLKVFGISYPILIVGLLIVVSICQKEISELNYKVEDRYIEKLPKEEANVLSYGNVDVTDIEIKNHYFTRKDSEILALKVRLNKDGIISERIIKAQVKVVKDLKQAYLEYQILEQDLSDNVENVRFKKGYYNTTLYIPE